MQCREFEQYLEQGIERPFPSEGEAHLNACGRCRAMVSDLEAIRAAARELAAEEVAPSERVWISLRAQLEAEGLIRQPRSSERIAAWRERWWQILPRPALAGAALAVLLLGAVVYGLLNRAPQPQVAREAEPPLIEESLGQQLTVVEQRAVSAMHPHDASVSASLQENLSIVDNFIALCEKSVREEPQNELAREYLYGAYQQKAELLAMMMDRSAAGD